MVSFGHFQKEKYLRILHNILIHSAFIWLIVRHANWPAFSSSLAAEMLEPPHSSGSIGSGKLLSHQYKSSTIFVLPAHSIHFVFFCPSDCCNLNVLILPFKYGKYNCRNQLDEKCLPARKNSRLHWSTRHIFSNEQICILQYVLNIRPLKSPLLLNITADIQTFWFEMERNPIIVHSS